MGPHRIRGWCARTRHRREARAQGEKVLGGTVHDVVTACVGGGPTPSESSTVLPTRLRVRGSSAGGARRSGAPASCTVRLYSYGRVGSGHEDESIWRGRLSGSGRDSHMHATAVLDTRRHRDEVIDSFQSCRARGIIPAEPEQPRWIPRRAGWRQTVGDLSVEATRESRR